MQLYNLEHQKWAKQNLFPFCLNNSVFQNNIAKSEGTAHFSEPSLTEFTQGSFF